MNVYAQIAPLETPLAAHRQGAKRHYRVHPYFTRRPYNVVRQYILHYSRPGDRVLDPFGGSGVTAIEAMLENRWGIHNDLHPLANFIAQGIADLQLRNISAYRQALDCLRESCEPQLAALENLGEAELQARLATVPLPENISLPSNSDVKTYFELFTTQQLISLALLKEGIQKLPTPYARQGMLLAWSATLGKLNKTFLSAAGRAESRGGSSIFSIYRYKVAKAPVSLPAWQTFYERALNVIMAKQEIDKVIELKQQTGGWAGKFQLYAQDIEELSHELKDEMDYIFTDPPYGGHISYLDLSTLWNHWLGQQLASQTRAKELIVGGELNFSQELYTRRLGESVRACLRMLKPGRWLSLVFQHWDTAYFDALLSSAAEAGGDLKAAVSQIGDPIWSMHKKKGSQSVLAGEMILTFYKTGQPRAIRKTNHFAVYAAIGEILSATKQERIYGEYLFNKIVIDAWKRSAIGSLNISRVDFGNMIRQYGWSYDEENHCWVNRQKFQTPLFDRLFVES
jgi:16S rRNA G966 N2-methylase RsmD